jgi:hypothetical protein
MKHLFFFLLMGVVLSLHSNAQNQGAKQVKNSKGGQPYEVENKNISIGNMAYAQKVLRAWKDYDDNTLDNSANMFAEDVIATFPDGTMIKGKDNFIKFIKDYRNSLTSASSMVRACTALKSPDRPNGQVVSIWGMETGVHQDGTTTKTHLNELWFFNKEGKVVEFHQLAAKDTEEKK